MVVYRTNKYVDWIQGNDLGRRFKALVCHDGVFSTQNQWATEELFFPEHDFGGTLWENRPGYEKWDPSKHTGEWATPQLVGRDCLVLVYSLLTIFRSSTMNSTTASPFRRACLCSMSSRPGESPASSSCSPTRTM